MSSQVIVEGLQIAVALCDGFKLLGRHEQCTFVKVTILKV